MIRRLFKLGFFLFLLAGWVVAASALHLVRSPGDLPYVGKLNVVPKQNLTFQGTYVDTTGWTANDLAKHSSLYDKLPAKVKNALQHVTSPAPAPAVTQAN